MSDNISLNLMSGGSKVATDEVTHSGETTHVQIIKLGLGAENALDLVLDSGQQTMANSMPVVIASDQTVIPVGGNVAADSADSGNPVKVGYRAIAYGSNVVVDSGDRVNAYANRHGIPFVLGGHPVVITKEWKFADADNAQSNVALISVTAGEKIVVTQIQVTVDNATTVDVGVRIGFAAATLTAAATTGIQGILLSHAGIAPGSGVSRGDGTGIVGVGADGEDVRITSEDPTSGEIRVVISYFTIES